MSFLKKYWPTISSVAGVAVSFLLPSISTFTSGHPKSVVSVLLGAVVAAYHATAPKDAK
jgi:hypothetical protein